MSPDSQDVPRGRAPSPSSIPDLSGLRPTLDRALAGWTEELAAQTRQAAARAVVGVDWSRLIPRSIDVSALLSPEVLKTFADLAAGLRSLIPENVQTLRSEDLVRLVAINQEQAIATAWVLDRAVISALLDAENRTARSVVIDRHATAIVDACVRVLDNIDREAFGQVTDLLREAATAYHDGHISAAQALSTNCLETGLDRYVDEGSLAARKYIARVLETQDDQQQERSVRILRWRLATAGIPTAYLRSDKALHGLYNRNGTVHAANPALYTPGNAARATALATSWLRWLQELNDHERRQSR